MTDRVAVIYARYSPGPNQTEQSIEGQLKICYDYAKAHNLSVAKEYIDKAQSGKTDERIQLKRMLADSKHKKFEVVLVYAIDRFGRNIMDSLNNENKLRQNEVEVLSATEHFENTPSGRFMRNIFMSKAQYYSEELAEKITRGQNISASKGLAIGGIPPLGYKKGADKKYILDEEKASIVKEIFEKYANGMGIKQICDDLNSRGLTSGKDRAFNKNSMHVMLKNRKYLGFYIFNGTEIPGGMPQIIDEDLFNKVAEKMEINKKLPARSRAFSEYLLTTKLFCGHCKEMMVGHSSNKISKGGVRYNYYKCKGASVHSGCKKKMALKDYIENTVVNECRKILTPDNIRKIAKEIVKIAESYDDTTEIDRLGGLIKIADKEKVNQMASLRACESDSLRAIIFEDLEKILADIKELERQLQLENARHNTIVSEKEVVDFLTKLAKGDVNDIVYRKTLVKVLVNKIFLYDDRFTITFNSGDEEVTITDILLANIEGNTDGQKFCLLNSSIRQKRKPSNV